MNESPESNLPIDSKFELGNQIHLLDQYAQHCPFFSCRFDHASNIMHVKFTGKFVCGILQNRSGTAEPIFNDEQEIELSLLPEFPRMPPKITWTTSIFHPNVPPGGRIHLPEIELQWDPRMSLDVICERLWDIARLAYLAPENSTNSSAGNWFQKQINVELPLDFRRFEIPQEIQLKNIFTYRLKTQGHAEPTRPQKDQVVVENPNGIIFID
ncbi:MAG TPA: ubiquitin-conjugating enzyme E2 [Pirellulaceae bacterium]|nr:ubiquitin-conjugating enzyme E2 [Pirellulaceae bacterium]HMO92339.1 ubiquitin-conjugating enzyme E2 [Pirellulaceae bacterium]HMP69263.1 ubiquitin-conjugating enzyme E2 [Pirellulaceae bacterium]